MQEKFFTTLVFRTLCEFRQTLLPTLRLIPFQDHPPRVALEPIPWLNRSLAGRRAHHPCRPRPWAGRASGSRRQRRRAVVVGSEQFFISLVFTVISQFWRSLNRSFNDFYLRDWLANRALSRDTNDRTQFLSHREWCRTWFRLKFEL